MKLSLLARYRIPVAATILIIAGAVAGLIPAAGNSRHWIWMAGLCAVSLPLLWKTSKGVFRGQFAADLVATLAILAAILLLQPLVGLVIVLMQSGGEALEDIAEGRATEALRALEDAAPRTVHRIEHGDIVDVDVDLVRERDELLVRPGEMVACDGEVIKGTSHIDTSSLTGEPMPVKAVPGSKVMSGSVNQESPIVLRVVAVAEESQYARIVSLVREAQGTKAPLQRIADRYAVLFTPLTLIACALAYAFSGDWDRVLAVLAIATPCPLILATPVAILGGMNQSARHQILVRNGGALEALGRTTAMLFDKTGTITAGRPRVSQVIAIGSMSESEVLGLASSVEHGSGHLLARTVVSAAEERGLFAEPAVSVIETPGRGVEGHSGTRQVAVGARSFIVERYPLVRQALEKMEASHGSGPALRAYVAVDGRLAGIIEYADVIRAGMRKLVDDLRAAGVHHILLLSGDRAENARAVAQEVGINEFRGDMLPEDKVETVKRLLDDGHSVVMIGDGTNDAPALSTATVGVAIASHGRGIATEAADVILLADDPSRVLDSIRISRRTMRIARQSIWFGLGISAVGMVFAAIGKIPPIAGAAIQEAVDLAVIFNALRASR
jgi:heavy metal translocating P-type ATPase